MEIRQLNYFLSVAKHLSFTKAAEECFVVQTTITHQISALENELGVKLFERNKRSVELTEYGKSIYEQAETIVNTANESLEKIRLIRNNYQYTLNIGYWGNLFSSYMPTVLQEFRQAYPNAQVILHQGNAIQLLEKLEKGEIDILISCHFYAWEGFSWIMEKEIYQDDLYVILRKDHPLSGEKSICMAQLAVYPIITFSGAGADDIRFRCQQEGYAANIVLELEDHQSIITSVESGYGVTLCAFKCIPPNNPNIAFVRFNSNDDKVRIVQYWKKSSKNAAIPWFQNILDRCDY